MANALIPGRTVLTTRISVQLMGPRASRAAVLLFSRDSVLLAPDPTSVFASPTVIPNNTVVVLPEYTGELWAALPGPAFKSYGGPGVIGELEFIEVYQDPISIPIGTSTSGPGNAITMAQPRSTFTAQITNAGTGAFSIQPEGSLNGQSWFPLGGALTAPGLVKLTGNIPPVTWVRLNLTSVASTALITGLIVGQ